MVGSAMNARAGLVSVFTLLLMLFAGLTVMLPVSAENSPPDIMSNPETIAWVGHEYYYKVVAIDYEKETLNYTLFFSPAGMTINKTSGDIHWTPTKDQVGTQIVGIAVVDPHGAKDMQNYTIEVMQPPPPMVELMSPSYGQKVKGTLTIEGYVFTVFYGGGYRNMTTETVKLSLVIYDQNKQVVWSYDTKVKTSDKMPYFEPNFKVEWDSTKVKDGKYFIVATATDVDGNDGTAQVDFSIHNTHSGEVIWFNGPQDGAMVKGYVGFKGGVTKDYDITQVQIRIDNAYDDQINGVVLDWTPAYGTTEWNYGYNFTPLEQQNKGGCFLVTVRAMAGQKDMGEATITVCTNTVIPPPPPPTEIKVWFNNPQDGSTVKGDVNIAFGAYSTIQCTMKASLKIVDSNGKSIEDLSFSGKSNGQDKTLWNFTWSTAKLADGIYYLGLTATTDYGASGSASIKLIVANVAPPPPPPPVDFKVWFDYPVDGAVVSGRANVVFTAAPNWDGNITGALEITDSASKVVRYDVKGIASQTNKMEWTYAWDTTQMSDGFAQIYLKVGNPGGTQAANAKVNVWIDNGIVTPPPVNNVTISFTSPKDGSTVSGTITVTGRTYCLDKIRSIQVDVAIDGKAYTTTMTTGGGWSDFSFQIVTTKFTDGDHKVSATMSLNGPVATASIHIIVKNGGTPPPPVPPPVIPGGQKNPDGSVSVPDTDVNFKAPDYSGMDKDKMNYTWDFGDGTTSHEKNPDHKYKTSGNYTVSLTASDGTTQKESAVDLKVGHGPAYSTTVPGFGASALVLGLILGCVATFFRRRK